MRTSKIGLVCLLLAACRPPAASPDAPNRAPTADHASQDPPRYFADKDEQAKLMLPPAAHAFLLAEMPQQDGYGEPVPHLLHRVNNGNSALNSAAGLAWRRYSDAMPWTLHTWTPEDVLNGTLPASSGVQDAVAASLGANRRDVANQLTGLSALVAHGGIWVGEQVTPPTVDGNPAVDLAQLFNLKGLTLATNLYARRVGGMSVYITTAFVAAQPEHPWLAYVTEAGAQNCLHLLAAGHGELPARYFAGNTFLSKYLPGLFQLMPFTYLQSIGMFPGVIEESDDDALH